ncbi:hypothetical protein F5884DRAFT_745363 [Xylogone sp. PMI_703]|nr:hypothetical protein F5884DRAFT_745363 [Xylogone sp. PMI_703]
MSLLWSHTLVFFASAAVPCSRIGTTEGLLNPLKRGQGFPIFDATELYFRAQNPNDRARGGDGNKFHSRVTKSHWASTPESVKNTLFDFGNSEGRNDALWLVPGLGMFYPGYWRDNKISPVQGRLDTPDTIITWLLPSGRAKVQLVDPDQSDPDPEFQSLVANGSWRKLVQFLVGINGDLDPETDYGYTSYQNLERTFLYRQELTERIVVLLTGGEYDPT